MTQNYNIKKSKRQFLSDFLGASAPAILFWFVLQIAGSGLLIIIDFIKREGSADTSHALQLYLMQHSGDVNAWITAISFCIAFFVVLRSVQRELTTFPKWMRVAWLNGTLHAKDGVDGRRMLEAQAYEADGSGPWKRLAGIPGNQSDDVFKVRSQILAAWFAAGLFTTVGMNVFFSVSGMIQTAGGAAYEGGSVSMGIGLAIYGILTPFIEEAVFRGAVYGGLRQRGLAGRYGTAALSAIVFGLYHGNAVQGIYAFCMGMIFALLYDNSVALGVCAKEADDLARGRIHRPGDTDPAGGAANNGRGNVLRYIVWPVGLHALANCVMLLLAGTNVYQLLCTPIWCAALLGGAIICIAAAVIIEQR